MMGSCLFHMCVGQNVDNNTGFHNIFEQGRPYGGKKIDKMKDKELSKDFIKYAINIQPTPSAFSQSKEISSDLCCFYGGGISHNQEIMHSFQKFIVV